jgi:hypothetical protein
LTFVETQEDKERRERLEAGMTAGGQPSAATGHTRSGRIESILFRLWHYAQCLELLLANPSGGFQKNRLWYLPSPIGLGIQHSADPNVAVIPFVKSDPSGELRIMSFIWPLRDIKSGEVLKKDNLPKSLPNEVKDIYSTLFDLKKPVLLDAIKAYEKVIPCLF